MLAGFLISIRTHVRARHAAARRGRHRRGHPAAAPRRQRRDPHHRARLARRSSPVTVVNALVVQLLLPRHRARRPGHPPRAPHACVRPLPAPQPRVPRALHVGARDLAAHERRRGARRAAQPGLRQPRQRGPADRRHRRGAARARLAARARGAASCSRSRSALTWWFRAKAEPAYRATREAVALVIVHFVESLAGIRAVHAFRREPRNQEIFDELDDRYRQALVRSNTLGSVYGAGIMFLGRLTTVIVLLYGGERVLAGDMTLGVLAAFLLYLRRFFEPMQELSQFYNQFQAAERGAGEARGRARRGRRASPEPASPATAAGAGGRAAVRGTCASRTASTRSSPTSTSPCPAGQTVALVGATGAGKTTLARLMARFYDPTDGRILLDGVDLRDLVRPRPAPRGRDGHAGQLPVLGHRRRQHRVRASRRVTRAEIEAAATRDRRARLHRRAARRVRHRHPEARRPPLGRATPARRVRTRLPRAARGAHPRRGDVVARPAERAAWCSARCARSSPTAPR